MRLRSSVSLQATAFALVVLSPVVRANLVVYDGFGPSFPIYANGGSGFAGPWMQGGFNAFPSGYVPLKDSLCFGRLETSGGGISAGAFPAINGAVRNLAQPLGLDNTTVYLSFLIQPRGTLNQGVFDG